MLSNSTARATLATLALLALSCSRFAPWRDEPSRPEVNLAFTLERNLIELSNVRVDNRPGRFILGTALPRTVLDIRFAVPPRPTNVLQLSQKETLRIDPIAQDLHGIAEGIIGSDPWRKAAITIDYRAGLVTYQKNGIIREAMTLFRFDAEPMMTVSVNGHETAVIVDTSSPDTLVLPGPNGRRTVDVAIAGTSFGPTDVRYAPVSHARIGNRLLSKFLVTIDYGHRLVGVWHDPRAGTAGSADWPGLRHACRLMEVWCERQIRPDRAAEISNGAIVPSALLILPADGTL